MRRLKTIDELYEEVKDYDLVITNDIALETALNSRISTPRIGQFAMTPRHIAELRAASFLRRRTISDLELISSVCDETGLDLRYVYSEIMNIREIAAYTSDVRQHLTTRDSRRVYDSMEALPTLDRVMSLYDPDGDPFYSGLRVAMIEPYLFDNMDKKFNPPMADEISMFRDGEYKIQEIREVGNDRQVAENAVDLIDPAHPEDYAIVLNASSPIADAVRAALYRRGLPFINKLAVRDLAQIRDYISFLTLSMSYETVRVGAVKELFSNYNGFFRQGRERFLLCRQGPEDMREKALELKEVMRAVHEDGMTFDEVKEAVCDRRARIQVGKIIRDLGIADRVVTPRELSNLRYAVDNVNELKHNEEIPASEKSGVLIADCMNSVYVDRPVVLYLGMEQDWNVRVVGKRYLDAEEESEKNAQRLEALLQQGSRRVYIVNATKNGAPARPCLSFDIIFNRKCDTFADVCASLVPGRWSQQEPSPMISKGAEELDPESEFDRPFSKTSFNAFYTCPRKYMFTSLLRDSDNKYTEFGQLIHTFAEFYACYPEYVDADGVDRFVDMISERYAGLSTPLMSELDRDRVRRALVNVMRFLDRLKVEAPLDTPIESDSHPNAIITNLGLPMGSSICEIERMSAKHPIKGVFDLYWDGSVIDYKTGSPHPGVTIAKDMSEGTRSQNPEFQPLLYLALALEEGGSDGRFRQFYVMDNDVGSADPGYDIMGSVRTVSVSRKELLDAAVSSPAFMEQVRTSLSKKFSPHHEAVVGAISRTAQGDPRSWRDQFAVVTAVMDAAGLKDTDTNRKDAAAAVGKVTKMLDGGMAVTPGEVIVPMSTLERFLEEADRMHREAVGMSVTEFPARPVCDCRKCDFYEACTTDVVSIEEAGEDE